jgi:hypothetical protein
MGENTAGQLGIDSVDNTYTPTLINTLNEFIISAAVGNVAQYGRTVLLTG